MNVYEYKHAHTNRYIYKYTMFVKIINEWKSYEFAILRNDIWEDWSGEREQDM